MAVETEIDVQVLKSEIKKTYASVSQEPEKDFIFPTGRPWAEDFGFEDTRRKAQKFGARGTTLKAHKPAARA